MAFELTTYDELKKELKLENPTLEEYPTLEVLKTSVEAAIESYLGRELESLARTESIYLPSWGTKLVALKGLPVASVATVTVTDGYGNVETLTEGSSFTIAPWGLRLFSIYKSMDLSVTYTGGYAAGSVPAAISRAAFLQTIYEYKKAPNLGAETVQNEGGSITYPELGLLKHVKELLLPERHPLKIGVG